MQSGPAVSEFAMAIFVLLGGIPGNIQSLEKSSDTSYDDMVFLSVDFWNELV